MSKGDYITFLEFGKSCPEGGQTFVRLQGRCRARKLIKGVISTTDARHIVSPRLPHVKVRGGGEGFRLPIKHLDKVPRIGYFLLSSNY